MTCGQPFLFSSTFLQKWTFKWWWIHVIDCFWILLMPVLRILTDGTLTAREAMNLKRLQGSSKTLNKTNYMYRVLRPEVNIFVAYKSLLLKMHFKLHKENMAWFFSRVCWPSQALLRNSPSEKLQHLCRALKNVWSLLEATYAFICYLEICLSTSAKLVSD